MASFTAGTTLTKFQEVKKTWYVIDAQDLVLGRLSAEVAKILRGKHKPSFTPHVDDGDNVIIVNAEKVALTGKKAEQDIHYWHTGHPGGIKERTKGQILDGRFPDRLIRLAVQRMLPKESPLARKQFSNLHVYAGPSHPHQAQNPVSLDISVKNKKNKRN